MLQWGHAAPELLERRAALLEEGRQELGVERAHGKVGSHPVDVVNRVVHVLAQRDAGRLRRRALDLLQRQPHRRRVSAHVVEAGQHGLERLEDAEQARRVLLGEAALEPRVELVDRDAMRRHLCGVVATSSDGTHDPRAYKFSYTALTLVDW
tara:strand:+ start:1267 stop:1722 length:456 start_codon:yes stop_codon:yes gene_type:complete